MNTLDDSSHSHNLNKHHCHVWFELERKLVVLVILRHEKVETQHTLTPIPLRALEAVSQGGHEGIER